MENLTLTDPATLLVVTLALALGGILKGATGAGLPIIAVPVIAAVYDIRMAVALMVIPNLITNLWQIRKFRQHALERGFARNFALSGATGAICGTFILALLPVSLLQLAIAATILIYIGLRLVNPALQLSLTAARKLLWPAGFGGGVLQGAAGVSAPIAVTFLNAMRLPRPVFIFTVSMYFASMCAAQLLFLSYLGLLTLDIAILGVFVLIPLFISMAIGEWIGRRISAVLFDRLILTALAVLATRLIWVELV